MVTIRALEEIINYYRDNNVTFKELFTLNKDTPFEVGPYDLFKAHYLDYALFSNDRKNVYARFSNIFIENAWIFEQIKNKIENINLLIAKDSYYTEQLTTQSQDTNNNQTQITNQETTQSTNNTSNSLTSDDNSLISPLRAQDLEAFNANLKSQTFTIDNFNNTTRNNLTNNNTINLNGTTKTLSKNTAQAIANIMDLDSLNFREFFILKFTPLFTNIKTDEEGGELLSYNYLSLEDFNKWLEEKQAKELSEKEVLETKLADINSLISNIQKYNNRTRRVLTELQIDIGDFNNNVTRNISRLERQLSELETRLARIPDSNYLTRQIQELRERMDRYVEFINRNTQNYEHLINTINDIQGQLADHNSNTNNLDADITRQLEEIRTTAGKIIELNNTINTLEDKYTALVNLIGDNTNLITQLQTEQRRIETAVLGALPTFRLAGSETGRITKNNRIIRINRPLLRNGIAYLTIDFTAPRTAAIYRVAQTFQMFLHPLPNKHYYYDFTAPVFTETLNIYADTYTCFFKVSGEETWETIEVEWLWEKVGASLIDDEREALEEWTITVNWYATGLDVPDR